MGKDESRACWSGEKSVWKSWTRTEGGQEEHGQTINVQSVKNHSIKRQQDKGMFNTLQRKMRRQQRFTGEGGKESWKGILEPNIKMKE